MAPMRILVVLAVLRMGACMKVVAKAHHQFSFEGKDRDSVVSKVIEMLGTEKNNIAEDIKKEAVTMEEYMEYCDDEQKEKDFAIRDSTRAIEDNSAIIEDNSAQIKALEEEIAEIGVQMADRQEEHEKIKAIRDRRHEEFKKRENEQVIIIGELVKMEAALKRQIAAMTTPPPAEEPAAEGEGEAAAEGGAEALLQTGHAAAHQSAFRMTDAQVRHMRQLMTRSVNALLLDPEAAAPNSGAFLQEQEGEDPSGGTADNLAQFEELKKKAQAALQREREQEKKEHGEFMVEKQSLMGAMKLMNTKLDDANEDKNALSEEKAQAEAELKSATDAKAADEKYLAELTRTCNEAAAAWEARQKDAAAEQAAIQKAMDILASRVKVLLIQTSSRTTRVSVSQPRGDAVRQKLIAHFRNLGTRLHSISMLNLVSAMSVSPMEKIKGLIAEMIEKLQKEAAEAASAHAFCEAENKKNAEAKEKTQGELDKINNRLDAATAKKTELTDRVAQLSTEIKEIEAADAEALKVRQEENAAFLKSEADFKEAADAVDDAIEVLKEYYGDVGIGAALVQTSAAKQPIAAPPKLGGAKSAGAGGILSILDMMSDEFTKTVADLQRAEREAVEAYEKLTNENENSKTAKLMEIKMSESQIMSLTEAIGDHETDKAQATKTMDAILEYIDKLKPTCEGRVVPYAERKAKREAEIEGLKEAFQILVDTAASMGFLQVGK